jgi:hypothetical protein
VVSLTVIMSSARSRTETVIGSRITDSPVDPGVRPPGGTATGSEASIRPAAMRR